jgi:ElaB/YqjD/DUF883 family membrane-anchored ribosome-binding protein
VALSDQAEGIVADAGQTVQRGLNQVSESTEQLSQVIRDKPLCAMLVAIGVGYVLGKIL